MPSTRALMFRLMGQGRDDDLGRVQFIWPLSERVDARLHDGWLLLVDELDIRDQLIEDARRAEEHHE